MIKHRFCPIRGVHLFGERADPARKRRAAARRAPARRRRRGRVAAAALRRPLILNPGQTLGAIPGSVLKPAAAYFGLVFGTGFVLGAIRVPFLVPAFGDRIAELIEAPLMLVAIVLAARWVVRRPFLLLITAPIMALGAWLPFMEWIAWGYALFVFAMMFTDWRLAGEIKQFELTRHHDTKLSLGADNPIRLSLRNRSRRGTSFTVRDEAPELFQIETRTMDGQVAGRSTWEHVYHVRPLRRGDYQFGDLSLRWIGPLGLIIRQAKVDAKEPVKVYPNLLDVRRYDLLLRRNRLQEMGLRTTRQFGEGTEFERLREYLPDDEYRRINWKATARRNRPVTVEYQTERSQSVIAVLATGRMMQTPVADIAKLA